MGKTLVCPRLITRCHASIAFPCSLLGIVYFILRILYTLVGVTAYFNGFGGQGAEIVPELSDIAARAAGTPGTY